MKLKNLNHMKNPIEELALEKYPVKIDEDGFTDLHLFERIAMKEGYNLKQSEIKELVEKYDNETKELAKNHAYLEHCGDFTPQGMAYAKNQEFINDLKTLL